MDPPRPPDPTSSKRSATPPPENSAPTVEPPVAKPINYKKPRPDEEDLRMMEMEARAAELSGQTVTPVPDWQQVGAGGKPVVNLGKKVKTEPLSYDALAKRVEVLEKERRKMILDHLKEQEKWKVKCSKLEKEKTEALESLSRMTVSLGALTQRLSFNEKSDDDRVAALEKVVFQTQSEPAFGNSMDGDRPPPITPTTFPPLDNRHTPVPSQSMQYATHTFATVSAKAPAQEALDVFRRPPPARPKTLHLSPYGPTTHLVDTLYFSPVKKMPFGQLKGVLAREKVQLQCIATMDFINTTETGRTGYAILEVVVAKYYSPQLVHLLSSRLKATQLPDYSPYIAADPHASSAAKDSFRDRYLQRCLSQSRRYDSSAGIRSLFRQFYLGAGGDSSVIRGEHFANAEEAEKHARDVEDGEAFFEEQESDDKMSGEEDAAQARGVMSEAEGSAPSS